MKSIKNFTHKNTMQQATFNQIVNNFPEIFKTYLDGTRDPIQAVKQALRKCNQQMANAVRDDAPETEALIASALEEAVSVYYTTEISAPEAAVLSISGDLALKNLYLLLLQETLINVHKHRRESPEPHIIPTYSLYAINLAAGIETQALPFIDWNAFSNRSLEAADLELSFLMRHPEIMGFLTPELFADEMNQLMEESLNGMLLSLIDHVNERCDLMQRTRLLNVIVNECSYKKFAHHLYICCQFDLNAILETRLVDRYVEAKIVEKLDLIPDEFVIVPIAANSTSVSRIKKGLTLKEQMQVVCADRAILYLYQEYFAFNQAPLESIGIFIPEALLQSKEPYEAWNDNPLLRQRSTHDAKALYAWFRKNRPVVEAWYKKYYRSYEQRWHDLFFTEVRNRCLLLAENSSAYKDKRTQLSEIFNDVTEMYAVFTPYGFFEIINSFEDRFANHVELYGREHKEMSLIKTIESINRDIAKLLLSTSFLPVTGTRLLESMLHFVEQDEQKYIFVLQNLLGNNCPRDAHGDRMSDKFQLEKYFFIFSLLSNQLNYLFTYAYVDNPLPGIKCGWNGVSGVYDREFWGLTKGALFNAACISTQTVSEMLVDPQHYLIKIDNFYTKFQAYTQEARIIPEDSDLIDVFFPSAPRGSLMSGVFGRRSEHNSGAISGVSFGNEK